MIGERLAEIRKDHGDKQKDLAKKLNIATNTVSSWEQEKSEPNHDMLARICRLYEVSADFLLGLSDEDPVYIRRRREETLSAEEQKILKDMEAFLRWRREKQNKRIKI